MKDISRKSQLTNTPSSSMRGKSHDPIIKNSDNSTIHS